MNARYYVYVCESEKSTDCVTFSRLNRDPQHFRRFSVSYRKKKNIKRFKRHFSCEEFRLQLPLKMAKKNDRFECVIIRMKNKGKLNSVILIRSNHHS